ncbi:MAG: hypothetical protein JSW37_02905 [Anaerolineales bacterium]|nr:MAG: hypothetical protein JSW37_02905 [Anaerolineales bacterium]
MTFELLHQAHGVEFAHNTCRVDWEPVSTFAHQLLDGFSAGCAEAIQTLQHLVPE